MTAAGLQPELAHLDVEGYEVVIRGVHPASGCSVYVAVHDTTLGPALGGLRFWPHVSDQAALDDVLRLARGMTYKSAVARTHLGGGKALIRGHPKTDKSPDLFRFVAGMIDSLGGRYITAEDVGTTVEDMLVLRAHTKHVTGLPVERGSSGNPSPFTALGVYQGIKATWHEAAGTDSLRGVTAAVQGLGQTGSGIAGHLHREGAKLIVGDIAVERARDFAATHPGVRIVDAEAIYDAPCEIFSPCALGQTITEEHLARLKRCRAIAGSANNQLDRPQTAEAIARRGIVYAPDYVINAGGIINIAVELQPGGYDPEQARAWVGHIPKVLARIFERARREGITTDRAAQAHAEAELAAGRKV